MLRLILVLVAINVACCDDNCPAYTLFDYLTQNEDFPSFLSGTFLVVYTSAPLVHCHKVTFETDVTTNATTGRIESPGCCVQSDNYNFATDQLTYDIGPVTGYATNCPLLVNEQGIMKLLATHVSGSSFCLVVAVCQPDYHGISVLCDGPTPLLLTIQVLLFNIFGFLGLIQALALQTVNQTNCLFPTNNCP